MGKPALLKTIKSLERTIGVLSERIQENENTATDKVKALAQLSSTYAKLLMIKDKLKIKPFYR